MSRFTPIYLAQGRANTESANLYSSAHSWDVNIGVVSSQSQETRRLSTYPNPASKPSLIHNPGNANPALNISTTHSLTALIFGALRDSG